MSNKRLTAVWDLSIQKGTKLLALLSLADRSDDDGYCWPSHDDTAQRTRSARTYVISMMADIEADGEIYTHRTRGKVNEYLVIVGMTPEEIQAAMVARFKYSTDKAGEKMAEILTRLQNRPVSSTEPPTSSVKQTPPVSSTEPEPSLTLILEPSKDSAPAGATPKKKSSKKERDVRLDHPAIVAYRENARLHVPIVWRDQVIEVVGNKSKEWGDLVRSWVGKGWKPGNVEGMLELFENEHGSQKKKKRETMWIQHPDGQVEEIEVTR